MECWHSNTVTQSWTVTSNSVLLLLWSCSSVCDMSVQTRRSTESYRADSWAGHHVGKKWTLLPAVPLVLEAATSGAGLRALVNIIGRWCMMQFVLVHVKVNWKPWDHGNLFLTWGRNTVMDYRTGMVFIITKKNLKKEPKIYCSVVCLTLLLWFGDVTLLLVLM